MKQVLGLLRTWKWRRWLAICLGVLAMLVGYSGVSLTWAQNTQLVDAIAAIVNDDIITISEVREAMLPETEHLSRQYSGLALDQQVKASFKRTLTSLVDVQLQLTRARGLNLRVSEEDVNQQIDALKKQNDLADEQFVQLLKTRGLTLEAYKKQVAEGLLITKVVNAEVRARLTVLDTELQEAYRAKQQQYQVAGGQTVSHILFLLPPYATEQDEQRLRAKAESVLQQLRNGGDFAALARQYSDGPSAETNGLLGTFKPGELLPGFEEATAQLQPGQISDVVRTRIGFHIIRLEARQAAGMRPFAEVQEEIKSEILRNKTERKYQEWLESLRQQAYIKILHEG
jgi:peptidyl-prolyl cis-trans isomerase SurA